MARAALGWSTRDLAKKAGVSPSTVNQFEQGIVARNRSTLAAIRRVFEDAGIEFTNGDKPGVAIAINAKEQLKKKARRSVPRRADNWQGFRRLPQLCFN